MYFRIKYVTECSKSKQSQDMYFNKNIQWNIFCEKLKFIELIIREKNQTNYS